MKNQKPEKLLNCLEEVGFSKTVRNIQEYNKKKSHFYGWNFSKLKRK
jgi:hypothetical protein